MIIIDSVLFIIAGFFPRILLLGLMTYFHSVSAEFGEEKDSSTFFSPAGLISDGLECHIYFSLYPVEFWISWNCFFSLSVTINNI